MSVKETIDEAYRVAYPAGGDWSVLRAGCSRADYSASRVARAVEDCDAHLLNLNVLSFGESYRADDDGDDDWDVVFELRANLRNAPGIARSLERYGFTVLSAGSSDDSSAGDTDRERLEALMRYLNP